MIVHREIGGGQGDGGGQQGDGGPQGNDGGANGDSGSNGDEPDGGSPPPEQQDGGAPPPPPQSLAPLDQLERNAQDLQQMMLRRRAGQTPRNPDDER